MEAILSILNFIWTLFLVVMVFNFMILVHELGHFWAGKWRGLVVDRFQIWFGKPIWKKEIDGVQWGLGWIPAGGFVSLPQMVTMEGIEGEVDEKLKKDLPPISPLDKIIVAAAGPLFSLLLAFAFAVAAWMIKYPSTEASQSTEVAFVVEGSPAQQGGILKGDKILSVGGVEIDSFRGMGTSLTWQVISAEKGPTEVVVERDGKTQKLTVEIPEPKKPEVEGGVVKQVLGAIFTRPPLPKIGVGNRVSAVVLGTRENSPAEKAGLVEGDKIVAINGEPVYSAYDVSDRKWEEGKTYQIDIERGAEKDKAGKKMTVTLDPRAPEIVKSEDPKSREEFINDPTDLTGLALDGRGLYKLVSDNPVKIVSDGAQSIYQTLTKVFSPRSAISGAHLSGPVGIGGILYDFLRNDGWRKVIFFGALLNVNLAILNMLPFPVLDGGHIVMGAAEWIRKKPAPPKLLLVLQNAFVFLLFGFMIFISFKDVGDRIPDSEKKAKVEYGWR